MKPFIEISSTNKLFNFMEILRIHKAFLEPQGHLKTVTGHPKESFFLNNPIFQSSIMHSHSISIHEGPTLCLALCFALWGKEKKDSPCF